MAWAVIHKFVAEGVVNLVDGKNVFGDEHQACMCASFAREEVVPLYYQGTEALQFWHERQDGKGVTKYDEVYWHFYGIDEEGQEDWTLH